MIRVVSLADNASDNPRLPAQHGLSLYIETKRHRLLFDVGQDDLYARNAAALGIDLSLVDTVVISHGHYDHGGGLAHLTEHVPKAAVYVRREAFGEHYSKRADGWHFIGLPTALSSHPSLRFTDKECVIDEELTLFSGVTERTLPPSLNSRLYEKAGEDFIPDTFLHEQYLVVTDGGRQVLFTGCSHAGIVPIVRAFDGRYRTDAAPVVIGGFHLFNHGDGAEEAPQTVAAVTDALTETGFTYFTCHCTGTEVCRRMRERMGDRLSYLPTGAERVLFAE